MKGLIKVMLIILNLVTCKVSKYRLKTTTKANLE